MLHVPWSATERERGASGLVQQALEGDTGAARVVLGYCIGPTVDERVEEGYRVPAELGYPVPTLEGGADSERVFPEKRCANPGPSVPGDAAG